MHRLDEKSEFTIEVPENGQYVLEDVEVLQNLRKEDIEQRMQEIEAQLDSMKDEVNLKAIDEYYSKHTEYLHRIALVETLSHQRDEARSVYFTLRKRRTDEFMAGFNTISLRLKELYQMLTLGGDAELELVDSLDPFGEGVLFSVRPPRKSWKQIANLSGGEKTLSSLALVFALHAYKPTPLYVMDEIDAALDFRNVSIVGNYLTERTKDSQFIVISLRNNMFELADRLVGIYKTSNTTKSITIDPKKLSMPRGVMNADAVEYKQDERQVLSDATNRITHLK